MVAEVNFYFVVTIANTTTTCTQNNEKALGETYLTQPWKDDGKIKRGERVLK